MKTRENITKQKKGTLFLCALFLSLALAGCGAKKNLKKTRAGNHSLIKKVGKSVSHACGEHDLPLPLQTTALEEGTFSGCYETLLTRDEMAAFCKQAYEVDGWDVTDFSNNDRLLLIGNKPEKMVVIDGYTLAGYNIFYVSLKRWDAPVRTERPEELV